MALTSNQCKMIESLAKNDLGAAKKAAIQCCLEDKSKKNQWFTDSYLKILTNNTRSVMNSIPENIKFKLVGDIPENFNESRYYLSEAESGVYKKIYRMKQVSKKMDELKLEYSNSTLLYGPSGTGKTMFGKYVSYKLGLPFFYLNFSQIIDSFLGNTSKNICSVFEFVKQTPCVFMLDEIDCIATKRSVSGSRGADGELYRTTISIMQAMDQLPNSVILIAATNRLDVLDGAILSRFSQKHEMLAFDEMDNLNMIYRFMSEFEELKEMGISFTNDELLEIIRENESQRAIINSIKQIIGKKIYECVDFPDEEDEDLSGAYEVTYTYKTTVAADNIDEALNLAKNDFQMNSYKAVSDVKRI